MQSYTLPYWLLLAATVLSFQLRAQTGCPALQPLTVAATSSAFCPDELDSLIVNGDTANPDYHWFQLNAAAWQSNTLSGSTPVAIDAGPDLTTYGLFNSGGYSIYALTNQAWTSATTNLPSGLVAYDLAVSNTNELYVATVSNTTNRASVWEFSSGSWNVLGASDITSQSPSNLDLEVDASGNVFLAFSNDSLFDYASVLKYTSPGGWGFLGGGNVGAQPATGLDLELGDGLTPHLALMHDMGAWRVTCHRNLSGSWSALSSGVSSHILSEIDLELIGSIPYIAYERTSHNRVYVRRWVASSWSSVGAFNGSTYGDYPALTALNGQPVVGYTDGSVIRFARWQNAAWEPYWEPLPATGPFPLLELQELGKPVVRVSSDFYQYNDTVQNANAADTLLATTLPGSYMVVSTDSCGNVAVSNLVEIEYKPLPDYALTQAAVRCNGESNGNAAVTLTGSNPINAYLWSTGATTVAIDNLSSGAYSVTLTGSHCVLTDSVVVAQPGILSTNYSIEPASCGPQRNGAAIPTTTGGTAPYQYAANTWAASATGLYHLPGGSYEAVTIDVKGCEDRDSVFIPLLDSTAVIAITQTPDATLCGDSVELTTTQTLLQPRWSRLDSGSWNHSASGLLSYSILSSDIELWETPSGELIAARQKASFNSQSTVQRLRNGSWQDISISTPRFMTYKSGTLVAARTNSSGCAVYIRPDSATSWQQVGNLGYTYSQVTDIDFDFSDGVLYALVCETNGIGPDSTLLQRYDPYTNSWVYQAGYRFSAASTRCQLSIAPDGTMYGFATGNFGNMRLRKFNGSNWQNVSVGAFTVDQERFDFEITENNRILAAYYNTVVDTVYLVEWANSTWNTLLARKYSGYPRVSICTRDTTGLALMVGSGSFDLYQQAGDHWFEYPDFTDFGNGADVVLHSDGTVWAISTGSDGRVRQYVPALLDSTASVFVDRPGIYQVTAGDTGCTGLAQLVQVHARPRAIIQQLQPVSCNGSANAQLVVEMITEAGVGPYTFLWSTGSTQDTIFNLSGGTYYVSATDANGCVAIDSITLAEPDTFKLQSIAANAPRCVGASSGLVVAVATGGTQPHSFAWPANWPLSYDSVLLAPGSYVLPAVDTRGCTDSLGFTVPVPTDSVGSINGFNSIEFNCGDTLEFTAQASAANYQWYTMYSGSWGQLGPPVLDVTPPAVTNAISIAKGPTDNYLVALSNYYFQPNGIAHVREYNAFEWQDFGPAFSTGNYVRNTTMDVDAGKLPWVSYIRDEGSIDSLLVKRWNGAGWTTAYAVSATNIRDLDLQYDSVADRMYMAYTHDGGPGIVLLSINASTVDTISGAAIGFGSYTNVDLDLQASGECYLLGTYSGVGHAFVWDGAMLSAVDVSGLSGWVNRSRLEIAANGTLYANVTSGVYRKDGSSWVELGNVPNWNATVVLELSPQDILYYGAYGVAHMWDGIQWHETNNFYPNGSSAMDLNFTEAGVPYKASYSGNAWLEVYEPDSIAGASDSSFTSIGRSHLMVTASSGSCTQQRVVAVEVAGSTYDKNPHLTCRGDSTTLNPAPINMGDSLSYLWSTGDTSSALNNVVAGSYAVTITGTACTIFDSIFVSEDAHIEVVLDSIVPVSCNGHDDGSISVSVISTQPYTIGWLDNHNASYGYRTYLAAWDFGAYATVDGCIDSDTLHMTVPEPAAVNVPVQQNGLTQSLCTGDSLILSVQPDTGANVSWYSFDSLGWRTIGGLNGDNSSGFFIEKDGQLYMSGTRNSKAAMFVLNNERWDLAWQDSVGGFGGSMVLDTNNAIIMLVRAGDNYRALRFGVDTVNILSYSFSDLGSYKEAYLNYVDGLLTLVYAYDHPIWSFQEEYNVIQHDGITWASLANVPAAGVDPFGDFRVEVDAVGGLWIMYLEANRMTVDHYVGGTWTQEHALNIGWQTPRMAMHGMPDGSLWLISQYYHSVASRGAHIMHYDAGSWTTVTKRHPAMEVKTFNWFDLSHDPLGNPLVVERDTAYTWQDTNWVALEGQLAQVLVPRIIERSCGYPMVEYGNGDIEQLIPLLPVATADSISVAEPGTFQPLVEKNGCVSYEACPAVIAPAFTMQLQSLRSVECAGVASGQLRADVSTGGGAGFQYLWSTADTTQVLDSVPAGTYYITVTVGGTCAQVDSIVLTPGQAFGLSLVQELGNQCAAEQNGLLEVAPVDGVGQITYAWSNAATTAQISGLGNGTYSVVLTDSLGCTADTTLTIVPIDTTPPVVDAQDVVRYIKANGLASVVPNAIDPNASDNCGIETASVWPKRFTCADVALSPIEVVLTVIDSAGNTTTDTALVSLFDTLAPVAMATPATTVYLGANGVAMLQPSDLDLGSYDSCGIDTMALLHTSYSCADDTVQSWFWVADANGNVDSQQVSIYVVDSLSPVVSLAAVDTLYLDSSGVLPLTASLLLDTVFDNCGIASLTIAPDTLDCSHAGAGPQTVQITVTDSSGNTTEPQLHIVLIDTLHPTALPQLSVTIRLDSSGQAAITAAAVDSATYTSCGSPVLSISANQFTCANLGTNTVWFTATDVAGRSDSALVQIEVLDSIFVNSQAPPIVLYPNAQGTAVLNEQAAVATISSGCPLDSIWLSQSLFTCADTAAMPVQLYGSNAAGQLDSVPAQIVVQDTLYPIAQPFAQLTLYLDSNGVAVANPLHADSASIDNCTLAAYLLSVDSVDCSFTSPISAMYTAVDVSGNCDSAAIEIVVLDTIAPEVQLMPAVTVYLDSAGLGSVALQQLLVEVSDNCAVEDTSTSSLVFGCADAVLGFATVHIAATDSSGNSTIDSVQVSVLDTIAPVVQLVQSATVYLDTAGEGSTTLQQLLIAVSDNCAMDDTTASTVLFGCADALTGFATVYITATDSSGNSTLDSVQVTVLDTIAPVVQLVQSAAVYLDSTGHASVMMQQLLVDVSDNCAVDDTSASTLVFGCADALLGVVTVHITATDSSGNSTTDSVQVTVLDTIAPQLSPQTITLFLDLAGSATLLLTDLVIPSLDSCGVDSVWITNPLFDCADTATVNTWLVATDAAGNTDSVIVSVTVIDTLVPSISVQPDTLYLDAQGMATLQLGDLNTVADDNCGSPLVSMPVQAFSCAGIGVHQITVTATDSFGNSDSATASITVLDTIAPVIAPPGVSTLYLDVNGVVVLQNYVTLSATDNCSMPTATLITNDFTCADVGAQAITIIASDSVGNTSTLVTNVAVVDTLGNNIQCPGDTSLCEGTYSWLNLVSGGACTNTIAQLDGFIDGAVLEVGTFNYAFEATSISGATSTCSYTVEVLALPVLILGPDTSVVAGESITLSLPGFNGTYLWSTGATGNSIQLTPVADTTIAVQATTADGCTASDSIFIGLDTSIFVPRIAANRSNGLEVYPNPGRGRFIAQLRQPLNTAVEVVVLGVGGKQVFSQWYGTDQQYTLPLEHLARGSYVVVVRSATESYRTLLLIQ